MNASEIELFDKLILFSIDGDSPNIEYLMYLRNCEGNLGLIRAAQNACVILLHQQTHCLCDVRRIVIVGSEVLGYLESGGTMYLVKPLTQEVIPLEIEVTL